jgi:predicted PolB exonuclease-like 3'-5' exonuclease
MNLTDLSKILFLDIETVPQTESLAEMPDDLAHLWEEKFELIRKRMPEKYADDADAAGGFASSAGIYAEFGRIVCISVGFIYFKGHEMFFRLKSFSGDDERIILQDFAQMLVRFCTSREHTLCGHNIREFDIPYICRRMLVNGLELPPVLNISGKKPWEITFIDTLELWKFGDYKNYTSLKLLTAIFGIPTPKDDIDGSQVAQVYYREKNIERIAHYCQKDVLATAQVYLKLNNFPTINIQNVEFALT